MKLPRTFRPDKDLEEKTIRLAEEAEIFKVVKGRYGLNEELTDLIEEVKFGSHYCKDNFHKQISNIIANTDYELSNWDYISGVFPFYEGRDCYEHWTRPCPDENSMTNVLTRRTRIQGVRRYSLAVVPNERLGDFYKDFKKYARFYSLIHEDTWRLTKPFYGGVVVSGLISGFTLGCAAVTSGTGPESLTNFEAFLYGGMMGALSGCSAFAGIIKIAEKYIKKNCEKRRKHLMTYSESLTMDDLEVLAKAFR
ncbi:MAG: hypothetical protein KKA79_10730 [Nanoarchaeota archaeon]|nr:hypothetical protein [Nanoarchaeota archaeon]